MDRGGWSGVNHDDVLAMILSRPRSVPLPISNIR